MSCPGPEHVFTSWRALWRFWTGLQADEPWDVQYKRAFPYDEHAKLLRHGEDHHSSFLIWSQRRVLFVKSVHRLLPVVCSGYLDAFALWAGYFYANLFRIQNYFHLYRPALDLFSWLHTQGVRGRSGLVRLEPFAISQHTGNRSDLDMTLPRIASSSPKLQPYEQGLAARGACSAMQLSMHQCYGMGQTRERPSPELETLEPSRQADSSLNAK